jgi:hypothetical protein
MSTIKHEHKLNLGKAKHEHKLNLGTAKHEHKLNLGKKKVKRGLVPAKSIKNIKC